MTTAAPTHTVCCGFCEDVLSDQAAVIVASDGSRADDKIYDVRCAEQVFRFCPHLAANGYTIKTGSVSNLVRAKEGAAK